MQHIRAEHRTVASDKGLRRTVWHPATSLHRRPPAVSALQPENHFAAIGADRVAYQISGSGSRDLLLTSGVWSHLDMLWEEPSIARVLRRLGSFSRVISFDRRGCGLSDPRPNDGGSLVEHWLQDLLCVMDATQANNPILLSMIDSGPLVLKFVERYPQRVSGLIFANTTACLRQAPDYPQGHSQSAIDAIRKFMTENWGRDESAAAFAPGQADNPAVLRWYAKFQRAMASPRIVADNLTQSADIDARNVLADIRVPTLVLTRSDLKLFPAAQARYMADHIPDARFVEFPGADMHIFWQNVDETMQLIEEFVTGRRRGGAPERALATVLFTDIVDSTRRAAKLGDSAWRELLDRHDRIIRAEIERHGGRLVDSAGDGTFATFATPGSAIDCAHALHAALKELKIRIRAGLHIGEVELREDGRVGGMAVHIGARVLGESEAGDVMVSRTVRDVLIGSPYRFKDRGIRELKGVPSKWPLYVVEPLRQR